MLLKLDCFGNIPSCDIIEDSNGAVYTPSDSIQESTVTFIPSSANYTNTSIIPDNPTVNSNVICAGIQNDSGSDGIINSCDKCPNHYNPSQEDVDDDSVGDICDNCPDVFNPDQTDSDGDCSGDSCDEFSEIYDPTQPDSDSDEVGDACDNCPDIVNPDQLDTYPPQGNNIGDACDCDCDFTCDGDVDALDITTFLEDFGSGSYDRPCTNAQPCNGDAECDGDVDAFDISMLLEDFGRGQYFNPCPTCEIGGWCSY